MELDETQWYPESERSKISIPLRYQIAFGPEGQVALRFQAIDKHPLLGWGAQLGLSSDDCRMLGTHLLDAAEMAEGIVATRKN